MGKQVQSAVTTLTAGCLGSECDFVVSAILYTPFLENKARLNSETLSQNKTDIEKFNLNDKSFLKKVTAVSLCTAE